MRERVENVKKVRTTSDDTGAKPVSEKSTGGKSGANAPVTTRSRPQEVRNRGNTSLM